MIFKKRSITSQKGPPQVLKRGPGEDGEIQLSIIIVSYQTKKEILRSLASIYKGGGEYSLEVIVVDNASTDGSLEAIAREFPQVEILANQENRGFSAANNQGLARAQGEYLLLLNPDTVIFPDTLALMLDFMKEHPQAGAAGCKVLLPDGSLDRACKRSFPTPLTSCYYFLGLSRFFPQSWRFGRYHLSYLGDDETHEVDCLMGAFLMVRRRVVQEVGGLDTDFFLFGEDIDWCYRIKEAGWKIYYYPKAVILHEKGASCQKNIWKSTYEFHRAMLLFYRKHYRHQYPFLLQLLVFLGVGFRFLTALLQILLLPIQGDGDHDQRESAGQEPD